MDSPCTAILHTYNHALRHKTNNYYYSYIKRLTSRVTRRNLQHQRSFLFPLWVGGKMEREEDNSSEHNPTLILQQANEKMEENDLDGVRMICQSALLDWVDDAREMSCNVDSTTVTKIRVAIATLWIGYANLYQSTKKYKAATETYEAAVNCPVAGSMGKVWREYARFQEERERHKSAQKIFLRALVGVEGADAAVADDEAEKELLWDEFLSMMKKLKNDDNLTLEQLRTAVKTEHMSQMQSTVDAKDKQASVNIDAMNKLQDFSHAPKRVKLENAYVGNGQVEGNLKGRWPNQNDNNNFDNLSPENTITKKAVETSSDALIKLTENMPRSLTAEWHARDGDALPSRPEPPLFSCSPPKLTDPSFKDILGTELALKLIRLIIKKSDSDVTGNIVLDIASGCWTMTALKEKEARVRMKILDEKLTTGLEKRESELDGRLSAAKLSVTGALLSAVQEVNNTEKRQFIDICNQQRQQLLVNISWEFRHLFVTQQQLLTAAGLPGFDGPTVDATSIHIQANICAFLHSSFYLRNRIGEEQHLTMLNNLATRVSSLPVIPMPSMPGIIAPPNLPSIPPPNQHFHGVPGPSVLGPGVPNFLPQNYLPVLPPPFPPPFPPPQPIMRYNRMQGPSFVPPPPPSHVMPPGQHLLIRPSIPNIGQPQYPLPPFR